MKIYGFIMVTISKKIDLNSGINKLNCKYLNLIGMKFKQGDNI